MSDSSTAARMPSTATIILAAAGLIAAASAGVAIYRANDAASPVMAGPHGSSAAPDQPVAPIEQKISELEARLKQKPNDPQGWRTLGWSHFETGDLAKSATAYRRATEVEPGNAENWSSLGEALQSATTSVSSEAAAAFKKAIALDAKDPRARYFLAVQKDLAGDHQGAVGDWLALLKDTPPGAVWETDLRRTIQQTADKHKIDIAGKVPPPTSGPVATAAIPGPTQEQLAAASSIPPSQQDEMVRGMVEGLAAKLAQNPKDANGWIRLMRSRMVLGDPDAARTAMRSGLAAFRDDKARQAQIREAAQQLGIPGGA